MARAKVFFVRLTLAILLLLVLAMAVLVLGLLRGVNINSLALGPVKVERLSAHLDGKLSLDIARLTIVRDKSASPSTTPPSIDPTLVRDLLRGIHLLAKIFKYIDIEQIEAGTLSGNFRYRENDAGHVNVHSPQVDIALDLSLDGDQLLVEVDKLEAPKFGLQFTGQVRVNPAGQQLQAALEGVVGDALPVQLTLEADSKQLTFSGKGLAPVTSIATIVDSFSLGPVITPWIVDYLRAGEYNLRELSGTLPYSDPAQILQTLRAVAHVEDVAYTFDQALEPVLASEAEIVFEKGFLHIYPKETTFYGQDGGSSYVDIDFNRRPIAVLVYVRTRAQLSAGINSVLAHYHIPLPFEQTAGLTDTDLTLTIDLKPVAVHTVGHFVTADSVMQMGEQSIQIAALDIGLQDSSISFNQLELALDRSRLGVGVSGKLDVAAHRGDLEITVDQFAWPLGKQAMVLQQTPGQPPLVYYHMRPQGDSIDIPATRWRYADLAIGVDELTTPFELATLSGDLAETRVTVDGSLRARVDVSGHYSARSPYADLRIALQALDVAGLQLERAPATLVLKVGGGVTLSTSTALNLSLKGLPLKLQPSRLHYASGVMHIQESGLSMSPGLNTRLHGEVNIARGAGQFVLQDAIITDKSGAPIFTADQKLSLRMSRQEGGTQLASPELALDFSYLANKSWTLNCTDIAPLYRQSPLLQRLGLDGGEVHLASPTGSTPYQLNAKLHDVFPILVQGNIPIHDYQVSGSFSGKKSQLTINEHLQVELAETLEINNTALGFNMPALAALAKQQSAATPAGGQKHQAAARSPAGSGQKPDQLKKPDQVSSGGLRLRLNASDSFLWLDKKRRAEFSRLTLHYAGGKVRADLQHHSGLATLEWAGGQLQLLGQGFDHTFFGDIITFASFEQGHMDFRVSGSPRDLNAAIRIKNTVIHDYKHLNNMLAFIDTVPALLTFQVPHYDSSGFPVKEVYVKVHYQDGEVDLESLHLNSDELVLNGSGVINLTDSTTDMTFNMATGVKKSIQRIPLLGYILAGDENRPTITLKVEGDLHDPEVSQTAFKEVVTYPFKILKRTVLLPDHMVKNVQGRRQKPAQSTPD